MMPAQRPGRSKQDYETPLEFIAAVERRWGPLRWDLACTHQNAKAPCYIYEDSLNKPWPTKGNAWLNPPFARIGPWAERCAQHRKLTFVDTTIFLLTPASVCTNWFTEYVMPYARVYLLQPRLSFDGKHPFPKDLILSVYGDEPGFEVWRWVE